MKKFVYSVAITFVVLFASPCVGQQDLGIYGRNELCNRLQMANDNLIVYIDLLVNKSDDESKQVHLLLLKLEVYKLQPRVRALKRKLEDFSQEKAGDAQKIIDVVYTEIIDIGIRNAAIFIVAGETFSPKEGARNRREIELMKTNLQKEIQKF